MLNRIYYIHCQINCVTAKEIFADENWAYRVAFVFFRRWEFDIWASRTYFRR